MLSLVLISQISSEAFGFRLWKKGTISINPNCYMTSIFCFVFLNTFFFSFSQNSLFRSLANQNNIVQLKQGLLTGDTHTPGGTWEGCRGYGQAGTEHRHLPPCTTTSQEQDWGGARAAVILCAATAIHDPVLSPLHVQPCATLPPTPTLGLAAHHTPLPTLCLAARSTLTKKRFKTPGLNKFQILKTQTIMGRSQKAKQTLSICFQMKLSLCR